MDELKRITIPEPPPAQYPYKSVWYDPEHKNRYPKDCIQAMKLSDLTEGERAYVATWEDGIFWEGTVHKDSSDYCTISHPDGWTHFIRETPEGLFMSISCPTKAMERIEFT